MCSWNIFGAQTNHEHTQTHKTHQCPNLGEATTFPLIVLYVISHGGCTQMSFCLRTPKLGVLKFRNSWHFEGMQFLVQTFD